MIIQIDTDTTALDYNQLTQLDSVEYLLHFFWSTKEECWYVDIFDQDGNLIVAPVKLVLGWSLLRRFTDPRLPPGLLFCWDSTGTGQEIATPDELGTRVPLLYVTADDAALA